MKSGTVSRLSLLVILMALLCAGPAGAEEPSLTAQAALGTAFTYQGRLTDNGMPANGTYDFEFKLYDGSDPATATQVGSTVARDDVSVSNGLFTVSLDFGATPFSGQALWLQVSVRPGDSADPHTPLAPPTALDAAPYAISLMPGIYVTASLGDKAIIATHNTGTGAVPVGLWGSSVNAAGVYGQSTNSIGVSGVGSIGVQGYATGSGVAVKAYGNGVIQSSARSYLWVSGDEAQVSTDRLTNFDVIYGWSGSVAVRAKTPTSCDLIVPISLPTVLYGQNVKVTEVSIYYQVENVDDKIDLTQLRRNTGAGSADLLVDDSTDRNSITATSYALTLTEPIALSEASGHLALRLLLNFTGTGGSRDIIIGGVRLTLEHD